MSFPGYQILILVANRNILYLVNADLLLLVAHVPLSCE